MLHHIQRAVIDVLASADPARYIDLKPSDLDGNQFTYHLKQLIADKLVVKNDDGMYSLTQKGRTYLVTRYENPDEMAHTIFLVVIRHGSQLLLRRRLVQPSLGAVGFLHGEPVVSQPLKESVMARIILKTGLTVTDITSHSSGLIRIFKDTKPESFSHAIIISAQAKSDKLGVIQDKTGENFWVKESELDTVKDLLPSCIDILATIDQKKHWFDLRYKL